MTVGTPRVSTVGRILGIALLIGGILGVILSIGGIIAGPIVVSQVGATAKSMLSLTVDGLNTAKVTLEQAKSGIQQLQSGLEVAETTIADVGTTVSESDETLTGILTTVSQDVPDALDSVQAAVPPAAESAKSFLVDVETAMVNTGNLVAQNGPLVNQAFKTVGQDVPDTLDYWSKTLTSTAQTAHNLLAAFDPALVTTGETLKQADVAWQQWVGFVSNDVPNTIDYWNAAIPPNAELAKAYLANLEANLENASAIAGQTDATLDQAVKVVSHDVPDAIDFWRTAIPPNAELLKAYARSAEVNLANASAMADQAETYLDQTFKVVSHDVPDAIDAWNSVIPANAELVKAYANAAEINLANASAVTAQADATLDQAIKVVSQDVPNAIDAWNSVIPANAELAKAYASAAEANLANASVATAQADAALDQTVKLVSQDVPNAIDAWNGVIPANAELAKAYATNFEANLAYAGAAAAQADVALDQVVKIASQDVPNTLDAINANIPVVAQAAESTLDNVENSVAWADLGLAGTRSALDTTTEVVPPTLEQISDSLPAVTEVTEANINQALALMRDLGYLDGTYRVDLSEEQVAANLAYLAALVRALDSAVGSNLDAVDQNLTVLSYNAALLDQQVSQYETLSAQLELISQQLRSLEMAYNANVDLETLSQQLLAMAQTAAAMKPQIDQLAALSSQQLDLTSQQLRGLGAAYDSSIDLGALSQNLMALSQSAAAVQPQIDQLAALTSQQLDLTSQQLRTLETVYNQSVDLGALSQNLMAMSQSAAAVQPQIDQLAALTSQQLALTSQQLRALETVYNQSVDLGTLSQNLMAMSQSAAAVQPQIDQVATLSDQQLELVSQQLRALETVYNQSVDLEATSQYLAYLAENVAAVSAQVDQVAAVTEQLEQASQFLRALEAYSDIGLGDLGENVLAMRPYVGMVDQQVDPWVTAASQAAGQMAQWSDALRALEPYAHIDYGAIRGQILDLAAYLPGVRDQIDNLVAMSSQLEQVSSALRTLAPLAETDFTAIGQDISALSTNVSAVRAQVEQFAGTADQMVLEVDNTIASINQIQATLDSRLTLVKVGIIIFMIWILLVMLAPLYLGWVLVSGRVPFVTVES
ncbi:MAG: hypothetical protein Kow0063_16130 [Anaerolineae bacterium]